MHTCAFCHSDATRSNLFLNFMSQGPPQFRICSACYFVAVRHGYTVVCEDGAPLKQKVA